MQGTNSLSDEAHHLISEANRLLGQITDAEHETKHEKSAEKLDGEQKGAEMSPEQGFRFKLATINMNEREDRSNHKTNILFIGKGGWGLANVRLVGD